MSSQLSYRLHGREQRPKTLRKHYRDELDTGQVKASAKEPRAAVASMAVASATARMPRRVAVSCAFEVDGVRIAQKRAMWSSRREFAGAPAC